VKNGGRKNGNFIIVVDDDPIQLCFWQRILEDMGEHDLLLIADADKVKKALRERKCRLLISDIVLPGANGFDITRFANKTQPKCTVVLTSGYDADISRFDPAKLNFHLLHKPYMNIGELKKMLRHVLDGDTSYDDVSEDSFSENDEYPQVLEWKV
jgi:DNA-binding NtrC family response regulator